MTTKPRLTAIRATMAPAALALGISLALAGCSSGGQQQPQAASKPSVAEEVQAPEPIVLPTCDTMNSVAQQEYEDFGVEMFSEPAGETDFTTFEEVSGPVAQEAMAKAVQQQGCRWPVHSQGTVTQYVVELPAADQTTLIEAFRADPEVYEAEIDGATTFTSALPAPNPMMSGTEVSHIFLGDVWATVFDQGGQREYLQAALDAILAANPSLVEDDAQTEESTPSAPEQSELISLASLNEAGLSEQVAACDALLGSPQEAAVLIGLPTTGIERYEDDRASAPWSSAATTQLVDGQLDLACKYKYVPERHTVFVIFGVPGDDGTNTFCADSSDFCVATEDGQKMISVIKQGPDPSEWDYDEATLRDLLDRFTP